MATYNEKEAMAKLKKAVEVWEDCDPADCDCEECPIGKPMEMTAHDAGVKVVASVCSMISALQDVCLKPDAHEYKWD